MQKLAEPPAVIFTTAYDAYALKAFELHAVDYLVKPIRLRRLHDALSRVRAMTPLSLDVLQQLAPERAPAPERAGARPRDAGAGGQDPVHARRAEVRHHPHRRSASTCWRSRWRAWSRSSASASCASTATAWWRASTIDGFERSGEDSGEGGWVVVLRGLDERLPVSRRQQHVIKDFGRLNGA